MGLDPGQPGLTYELLTPGDGSLVVALRGELDMAWTEGLDAAVQGALGPSTTCLVVDARELRFADSSAIALWVKWSKEMPDLQIRDAHPLVRRVVEAMGLETTLQLS